MHRCASSKPLQAQPSTADHEQPLCCHQPHTILFVPTHWDAGCTACTGGGMAVVAATWRPAPAAATLAVCCGAAWLSACALRCSLSEGGWQLLQEATHRMWQTLALFTGSPAVSPMLNWPI